MNMSALVRYVVFSFELVLMFMLQQTPGLLPEIYGARPVVLIAAVIAIAMMEKEVPAAMFGIAGGLLIDFGLGSRLGFYAMVLGALCFLISVVGQHVLQVHLGTGILLAIPAAAAPVALGWVFHHLLQGYASPVYALTHHYLPQYLYTLLLFPLIFLITRGIARWLHTPE